MKARKNLSQTEVMAFAIGLTGSLLLSGCTTLPSCAWGKCAYPRSPALAPQMSERVYPWRYDEIFQTVKGHLEMRGYPLANADPAQDTIETEPYAEKQFARVLGIQYRWRVQVRKMDTLNTAVLPRLYLHEDGEPPRELSPGLWPEAYRFFFHEIEQALLELRESHQS